MDRAFSRRSFLKCTALTAVAIAGAGLLSGCEFGENPVQYELKTTNVVLRTQSTLESVSYEDGKAVFTFTVYNGRKNALQVDRNSFAVTTSRGYYAYKNDKIRVLNPIVNQPDDDEETNDSVDLVVGSQIKNKQTSKFIIEALDFPSLQPGETLTFTFFPDTEYSEYSSNWELSLDAAPEE